ncbi:MAG: hypothetical protein JWM71_1850, partial [Solirubrobacteraceae bacterium]|nr:hypothetical protein [Solirubrobacteraceae bacterium]
MGPAITSRRRELLQGAAAAGIAVALPPTASRAAITPTDLRPDVLHHARAIGITPQGDRLVVALSLRRTALIVDRRTGRRHKIELQGEPLDVAISPQGFLAALPTAAWEGPGVELLHLRGAVRRTRLLAGGSPYAAAFTPDRRLLLVSGDEQDGRLHVLRAPEFARPVEIPLGRVPRGIAVSRDSHVAWVALNGEDAVVRVDLHRHRVTGRIATAPQPDRIALSPDGRRLLVSHGGSRAATVTEVDIRSATHREIAHGRHPRAVAWPRP